MSTVMMDGRALAKVWKEKIAKQTNNLILEGIIPHLSVVLVGNVAPEVAEIAGYLIPVPGGVGQMTIAMLLANTLDAAK